MDDVNVVNNVVAASTSGDPLAFILAAAGIALMLGLASAGSIMGFAVNGCALLGAIKKKPEAFGTSLVLTSIPSTQGIYGFVGFFMYMPYVKLGISMFDAGVVLVAGLLLGVVCLSSAVEQAKITASGINSLGAGHNALGPGLICAALPEFFAILALVGAILMQPLMGKV